MSASAVDIVEQTSAIKPFFPSHFSVDFKFEGEVGELAMAIGQLLNSARWFNIIALGFHEINGSHLPGSYEIHDSHLLGVS
jgi:hypothetical protein